MEVVLEGGPGIGNEQRAAGHRTATRGRQLLRGDRREGRRRHALSISPRRGGVVPRPRLEVPAAGGPRPVEVVDPTAFEWADGGWKGLAIKGQVLYELHIGTFTMEGTWKAAIEHLPALKELGITCVEVMPVNEFPGRFGWGYDGVNLYAPIIYMGRPTTSVGSSTPPTAWASA